MVRHFIAGFQRFLSTLPAWGATFDRSVGSFRNKNFYPRSPRGERPHPHHSPTHSCLISIHAPRVGSDPFKFPSPIQPRTFLSTLPAWGATIPGIPSNIFSVNFYPRSPRGERPAVEQGEPGKNQEFLSTLPAWGATSRPQSSCSSPFSFLSTLPAWGATHRFLPRTHRREISIHAPRVGSDQRWQRSDGAEHHFYPRSPRGERRR